VVDSQAVGNGLGVRQLPSGCRSERTVSVIFLAALAVAAAAVAAIIVIKLRSNAEKVPG